MIFVTVKNVHQKKLRMHFILTYAFFQALKI